VPSVEVVLASPYARAWRTAEILADEAGWPAPEPCEALEAERPRSEAIRVLRTQAGHASLALVGHEPNLSELGSFLLTGSETRLLVDVKKGGVVCLSLDQGPAAGKSLLQWVATPKMLRGMAT